MGSTIFVHDLHDVTSGWTGSSDFLKEGHRRARLEEADGTAFQPV